MISWYYESMYTIFTDGSCDINYRGAKNIGGYAFVIINEHGVKTHEYVDKEENTTNNRMELMAVITAMKYANKLGEETLINSDSQYVVNSINQGWLQNWKRMDFKKGKFKKEIPNADLWKILDEQLSPKIKFKWVKSHTNTNSWNDYVDGLANKVFEKNFRVI